MKSKEINNKAYEVVASMYTNYFDRSNPSDQSKSMEAGKCKNRGNSQAQRLMKVKIPSDHLKLL